MFLQEHLFLWYPYAKESNKFWFWWMLKLMFLQNYTGQFFHQSSIRQPFTWVRFLKKKIFFFASESWQFGNGQNAINKDIFRFANSELSKITSLTFCCQDSINGSLLRTIQYKFIWFCSFRQNPDSARIEKVLKILDRFDCQIHISSTHISFPLERTLSKVFNWKMILKNHTFSLPPNTDGQKTPKNLFLFTNLSLISN